MKPDLSIIIISYNTKDITHTCLETIERSLLNTPLLIETIVLDNGSTDGSQAMLQKATHEYKKLNLQFIPSQDNLGFGIGNNSAVNHARADTLLFLNSDTEVIENALVELYSYFESRKNHFDIVGAKLIERDRKTPQASCGPEYTLWNIFLFLFLRGDYLHITRFSPTIIQKVDWVSGACFIMKKKNFLELGGFDKSIFMYMEEIDLFHRARQLGMSIGFYPHAHFIHLGSASSQKRTQPILQVYRGYLYYYKKFYSRRDIFILKILLQLKAIVSLLIGKLTHNSYLTETYEKALEIATLA